MVGRVFRLTLSGICLASCLSLSHGQASAQTIGLPRLDPGQKVWVTTADGTEMGKFLGFNPSGLEFKVDGKTKVVPVSRVRTIEVSESWVNGMILGTAVGVAGVFLASALGCTDDQPCNVWEGVPVGALIGAGVGFSLDFFRQGREAVYTAPTGHESWRIEATVKPRAAEVRVSVRWGSR